MFNSIQTGLLFVPLILEGGGGVKEPLIVTFLVIKAI